MTLYEFLSRSNDCYQLFKIIDVNDNTDIEDGDHLAYNIACEIYDEINTEEYQVESFNIGNDNDIIVWVYKPEGV